MVRQEAQHRLKDDSVIWRWSAPKMILRGKRQWRTGGAGMLLAGWLLLHLWHCTNWDSTINYLTAPSRNSVKWRILHTKKGKKTIKIVFRNTELCNKAKWWALTVLPLYLKRLETSVGCNAPFCVHISFLSTFFSSPRRMGFIRDGI